MRSLYRRRTTLGLGTASGALAIALPFLARAATDPYADPDAVYRALQDQPGIDLHFEGSTIRLVFADGADGLAQAPVIAWIRRSVQAVAAYFGRSPVQKYGLLVIADDSARVCHATTFG